MAKCCLTKNELLSILKKVKGNLFVYARENIHSEKADGGALIPITGVTIEEDSLDGKRIVLRSEGRYLLAKERPMRNISK